ncbi:hypothetical protein BCR37DRAFT_388770 [Protomyces lactucae-debilis]|uniref:Uncharacterized protein n=1 Tax=Protomyces lactucae-debilis TaxID=2754530 RepID=A0A1Y2F520_PROLT|nr:uncharacterized protein BCR37DRAFT_388770 [Protomyces lactucae-debilis]ORY78584.1 hypothetical protein BCR37DRAFT_388770 [Protomyces lactucae-debilis]
MAILRSSVLSCLILGTFVNAVDPSPPAAAAELRRHDTNSVQELSCKTVDFTLKTVIRVNVKRDSSSSTQPKPRTYNEVLEGLASSSNTKAYSEATTGSVSSSKPRTYADVVKGLGSSSSSSSPLNTNSSEAGPSNSPICEVACKTKVWKHRDRLASRPDICQIVISNDITPAYTTPGRRPSIYDWVYTRIVWEDSSLTCDSESAHIAEQKQARQKTCAAPDFDDHQCTCEIDLRVRRLLPGTFQSLPDGHGSFALYQISCHEDDVLKRLEYDGWQRQGHRLVGTKPCYQKDDADWVPNLYQDIVICYFKDPRYRASTPIMDSYFSFWGVMHSDYPPFI